MPQYTLQTKPKIGKVQSIFGEVIREIKDWAPLNQKLAAELDKWVQRNFKSDGGLVGGWAPFKYGGRLVTKTKKNKHGARVKNKSYNAQSLIKKGRAIDGSAKLLRDTTRLQKSFIPFSSGTTVGIGSELKYSAAHEFGLPEKNLPARRMLPRDSDVIDSLRKIHDRHIQQAINKKWKGKF